MMDIHIRYFFVTDRVRGKELSIKFCPRKEMMADFCTKPLQGGLFRKFGDLILGIDRKAIDRYV